MMPFSFPGPLIGMLLLLLCLQLKWVSLEKVERVGDHLLAHLSLLFIPAGVGVVSSWGLIKSQALTISLLIVVPTLVVIGITGLVVEFQIRRDTA